MGVRDGTHAPLTNDHSLVDHDVPSVYRIGTVLWPPTKVVFALHLVGCHVLDAVADIPTMPKRVEDHSRPLAVEGIGRRTHQRCTRRYGTRNDIISVVDVKMNRRTEVQLCVPDPTGRRDRRCRLVETELFYGAEHIAVERDCSAALRTHR